MLLGWLDSLRMNPIQRGTWVWLSENQRSWYDSVGTSLGQQGHSLATYAAIDYNLWTSAHPAAKVENGAYPLSSVAVEAQSFHTNFGAHHKQAIHNTKMEFLNRKGVAKFYNQARLSTSEPYLLQTRRNVIAKLPMNGQEVRARLRVPIDPSICVGQHQVHVEHLFGPPAQRSDKIQSK